MAPLHGRTEPPLAGVTVIEFAGMGPIPFAGMILAGLGADVIRVDRPGDRSFADPMLGALGRGKSSIALDLKRQGAVDIALRLVATADILIEGYRPGVMERLGIGPGECLEANPGLVYGRMTGWGSDGPYASMAGHDINYIALSGALHAIGTTDRATPPLNLVGDFGGGAMYLLAGVLAGLHRRDDLGGTVVDAAMVDGTFSLMSPFYEMLAAGTWEDRRATNVLDGGAPFYTTYETLDGELMAVGALEPSFYRALIDGLGIDPAGLPDQYDRGGWTELRSAIEAAFARKRRADWEAIFDGTDACVTPVLSLADAPGHAHNAARAVFVESGSHRLPGPAPRFDSMDPPRLEDAPEPGADSIAVLERLSYTATEVRRLLSAGVVV